MSLLKTIIADNKEIDIIVQDKQTGNIALIEVKRSNKIVANQYRWLIDESITNYIQSKLGPITHRYVLYNGEDKGIQPESGKMVEDVVGIGSSGTPRVEEPILYKNISKFLLSGRE